MRQRHFKFIVSVIQIAMLAEGASVFVRNPQGDDQPIPYLRGTIKRVLTECGTLEVLPEAGGATLKLAPAGVFPCSPTDSGAQSFPHLAAHSKDSDSPCALQSAPESPTTLS